jgi:hypothetical protein
VTQNIFNHIQRHVLLSEIPAEQSTKGIKDFITLIEQIITLFQIGTGVIAKRWCQGWKEDNRTDGVMLARQNNKRYNVYRKMQGVLV